MVYYILNRNTNRIFERDFDFVLGVKCASSKDESVQGTHGSVGVFGKHCGCCKFNGNSLTNPRISTSRYYGFYYPTVASKNNMFASAKISLINILWVASKWHCLKYFESCQKYDAVVEK